MLLQRHLVVTCLLVSLSAFTYALTDEEDESKSLESDLIILGVLKKIWALYYPVSVGGVCGNHSLQYKQGVNQGKIWALRMIDSSTKVPDGVLVGFVSQLGNYDECLAATAPDAGYGSFIGQHCLVAVEIKPEDVTATELIQKESTKELYFLQQQVKQYLLETQQLMRDGKESLGRKVISGIENIPDFVRLQVRWSFCIPSSCSAEDFTTHLTNGLAPLGLTASIDDGNCHTRDEEVFDWLFWFAVSVMILLGFLAFCSTSYDLLVTDKASRRPLFLAFSIYTNGKRLLDTSTPGSDVLPAVHGIRFLSISWVVFCHRWAFASDSHMNVSIDFFLDFWYDSGRMYIRNGNLSVDSFFLLSGTLVCYIFLKEMEKGSSFNIPLYYLHRYIRLTPPLAMMIFFQVAVFKHIGSGPQWTSNLWETNTCLENWWLDLLYVQNYFNAELMCLTQSWYLAVDMQLFWLSPLVLVPLWKWPKIGKPLLGLFMAASLATVFAISYVKEANINKAVDIHLTHMRTGVWLIGIGLGYLLHHTKKQCPKLNKWVVLLGWAAAIFMTVGNVFIIGPFVTQPIGTHIEYDRVLQAFLQAIIRPAFGLGLAWIVFACVRGYGGFINTFLSWSFFIPLSRLSYCIYLTHFAVLFALIGSMKKPINFDDSVLIPQFFGDMVISTGLATIMSLMVESPTMNLEKLLFKKDGSKSLASKKTNKSRDIIEGTEKTSDVILELEKTRVVLGIEYAKHN